MQNKTTGHIDTMQFTVFVTQTTMITLLTSSTEELPINASMSRQMMSSQDLLTLEFQAPCSDSKISLLKAEILVLSTSLQTSTTATYV